MLMLRVTCQQHSAKAYAAALHQATPARPMRHPTLAPIASPTQINAPVARHGRPRAEGAAHQAQLAGEGHRAAREVHVVVFFANGCCCSGSSRAAIRSSGGEGSRVDGRRRCRGHPPGPRQGGPPAGALQRRSAAGQHRPGVPQQPHEQRLLLRPGVDLQAALSGSARPDQRSERSQCQPGCRGVSAVPISNAASMRKRPSPRRPDWRTLAASQVTGRHTRAAPWVSRQVQADRLAGRFSSRSARAAACWRCISHCTVPRLRRCQPGRRQQLPPPPLPAAASPAPAAAARAAAPLLRSRCHSPAASAMVEAPAGCRSVGLQQAHWHRTAPVAALIPSPPCPLLPPPCRRTLIRLPVSGRASPGDAR